MQVKHRASAANSNLSLCAAVAGRAATSTCIDDEDDSPERVRAWAWLRCGAFTAAQAHADLSSVADCPAQAIPPQLRRMAARALCFLLSYGMLATRSAVPVPGDATIAFAGEPGKTSETHTVSFVLGAGEKPPVLVAGDLQRTAPSPARIDRAQVRVTPAATSPAGLANFEVTVTALPERYGSYKGSIAVSGGAGNVRASAIAVTLLVRVPVTQALTAFPPAIVLQLAAGKSSGHSILSNWPSAGDMRVAIAGLPAGAQVADVRMTALVSARGYGELEDKKYGVERSPSGLRFHADAARARADKYTAVAEIDLDGSDRRIAVPIEVTVRAPPLLVVALLVLGILLGRAAKWMNEGGQQLLAARARLNNLVLRVGAFEDDYRRHLDEPMDRLHRLVKQGRLGDFDAALAATLTLVETLERVASLRALARLKANNGARIRLDAIAAELRFLASPASAKGRLDVIETELTIAPDNANAAAAIVVTDAPADATSAPGAGWRSWKLRFAGALQTALEVAGVVLLAFVGYEVLYLNGSPTFGANFSDYFSVLVWGLGADVAARTITALGRVAAR